MLFAYLSTGTLPVGMEPRISVGANTGWSGSPISTDVGEATGQSLALNGSHHGRVHRNRHGAYKYIVINWSNQSNHNIIIGCMIFYIVNSPLRYKWFLYFSSFKCL